MLARLVTPWAVTVHAIDLKEIIVAEQFRNGDLLAQNGMEKIAILSESAQRRFLK